MVRCGKERPRRGVQIAFPTDNIRLEIWSFYFFIIEISHIDVISTPRQITAYIVLRTSGLFSFLFSFLCVSGKFLRTFFVELHCTTNYGIVLVFLICRYLTLCMINLGIFQKIHVQLPPSHIGSGENITA